MIEFKVLGPNDIALLEHVVPAVFDHAVSPNWAAEFLCDSRHHLVVALEVNLVVGFASGITYLHPDKPLELFVNEVGVAESHQGQGMGKRLMNTLLEHGRKLGCREAWVLTEQENNAANRLYSSMGGNPNDTVIYTFSLTS